MDLSFLLIWAFFSCPAEEDAEVEEAEEEEAAPASDEVDAPLGFLGSTWAWISVYSRARAQ